MKKWLSLLLALLLTLQTAAVYAQGNQAPGNQAPGNQAQGDERLVEFKSPFLEDPIFTRVLIRGGELYLDAGTLAGLTGYDVTLGRQGITFERGMRSINVTSGGTAALGQARWQLGELVLDSGYIYLPLSPALRLLGGVGVAGGNKIYVLCNETAIYDSHTPYWQYEMLYFDRDKYLGINEFALKSGIFIATIFDKYMEYIVNIISGQGPNSSKYEDAALYCLTMEADRQSALGAESALMLLDYHGYLADVIGTLDDSLDILESVTDPRIWGALDGIGRSADAAQLTSTALGYYITYVKLENVGPEQIAALRQVVEQPGGNRRRGISTSMRSGVETAVGKAEKSFEAYAESILFDGAEILFDRALKEGAGLLGQSALSSVLAGVTIGNAIMQLTNGEVFARMDRFDSAYCLMDMQDAVMPEVEQLVRKLYNGTINEEEAIALHYCTMFLEYSSMAISSLLQDIYQDKRGSGDNMEIAYSLWQTIYHANKDRLEIFLLDEESIRLDVIPPNLWDTPGHITPAMLTGGDGPAPGTEDSSKGEEALLELIRKAQGDPIVHYVYGDFDSDGSYEVYALAGTEGEYGCEGAIWYADAEGAVAVERKVRNYYVRDRISTVTFGEATFLSLMEGYGGSGTVGYLHGVSGAVPYSPQVSGRAASFGKNDEGELVATHSTLDITAEGTGHTWKPYYFFYAAGEFLEYGAIPVSLEEVYTAGGAEELIGDYFSGKNIPLSAVTGCLYRGNSMIHINYTHNGSNGNLTLRLTQAGPQLYHEDDGVYKEALLPDLAVYPENPFRGAEEAPSPKISLGAEYPPVPAEVSQAFYVIFDEGYRNGRLEMSVFDIEDYRQGDHVVWNRNMTVNDRGRFQNCDQYYYDEETGGWILFLEKYSVITDYALRVHRSNLDIRDGDGALILEGQ